MKKFTKLTLTLAMLFGIVGGVNSRTAIDMSTATASTNATWNSETNTFTWTAENEYVVIPGLSGDLTGCYLDFTIGAACHINIIDDDDNVMEGGWNGYGRFGSAGSKTQDLEFMASGSSCNITKVKEVRICSQSASGNMTVTSVSYYFPLKLEYNSSGVATVPFYNIITSGGVTFDKSTGIVTNTDGTGYLAIELPNGGIDLTTIKRIDVEYTGDDSNVWADSRVLQSCTINDNNNGNVNTWQGSRYGIDYSSYSSKSSQVNTIKWDAGTLTGGTITISAIKFTSEFVSCAKAGETVLNTLPWNKIDGSGTEVPAWNMNGSSDTYYGNGSGDATHYADLTAFSELRVYCKSNTDGFRAFFIKADKSGTNTYSTSGATWHATEKYYSLDLSTVTKWDDKVALKSIKSDPWSGTTTGQNVTNIVAYKTPAAGSSQYQITGKGLLDAKTTALLADATVTSIDATGMTNVTATTLTSANSNCLFIANSGKLSNTKNVIVSGTCANLELTDGKPFKAPAAFTATAAPTYSRAFTVDNTTTVCLPFALTSEEAATLGTFYELNSFDGGNTLHFTSVAAPVANKAYLVTPTAAGLTLSETGKSIAATPADLGTTVSSVDFIGTLAATEIPASDGTYSYYAYNDGALVKVVTKAATLPAFRGYFKVETSAISLAPVLNIVFDDVVTGVIDVRSKMSDVRSDFFDLQGRRIGQPTKGLYIVNGKKVVIK